MAVPGLRFAGESDINAPHSETSITSPSAWLVAGSNLKSKYTLLPMDVTERALWNYYLGGYSNGKCYPKMSYQMDIFDELRFQQVEPNSRIRYYS